MMGCFFLRLATLSCSAGITVTVFVFGSVVFDIISAASSPLPFDFVSDAAIVSAGWRESGI